MRTLLQTNCRSCHSSQFPRAPSYFADASQEVAYAPAKQFVDFQEPSNSFFVQRMREGHNCGANCSSLEQEFTRAISEWAKSEIRAVPNGCLDRGALETDRTFTVQTQPQFVPTTLTLGDTVRLTYDLKQATPSVSKAVLRVTLQRFTEASESDSGTYQLSGPLLAIAPRNEEPLANIAVSQVSILFNGQENLLYRNFLALRFVFKPKSFILSTISTLFHPFSDLVQHITWQDPAGDWISFRFTIERTPEKPTPIFINPYLCKAEDHFLENILPLYTETTRIPEGQAAPVSCLDCHAANKPAHSEFPIVGGVNSCEEFKKRANLDNPLGSLFLTYPSGMVHGGGQFVFTVAERNKITTWLSMEK